MNGLNIVSDRKKAQALKEKFDRRWLNKASEIEEKRYSLACALVTMDRNDSSLNLHETIQRLHSLPSVLIFRDWFESKDRHSMFPSTRQLLQWLNSKQVGSRRSLSDIGGGLNIPSHVYQALIDASNEYYEYLDNFKTIPSNFN